jgi:hypothetical protein
MVGLELGEDGDRDAAVAAGQQGDLVIDKAGAAPPATLEEEAPAAAAAPIRLTRLPARHRECDR